MSRRDIIAWVAVIFALAWMAYDRQNAHPENDCQAYDRIGNGIGCEGPDIGDR
ncbi:MAG: hypothetical protein H6R26_2852 [Proteobacteria bacterium]|nr:hypothetical protein [Pseudomonadota bacterium]